MTFQRARSTEQIAQRKTALLNAAAELLAQRGYDKVTLRAISKHAGITKASTYRYFESKEDIYLHLLIENCSEWLVALEKALAPMAEKGDVKTVSEIIVRSMTQRPKLWNLMAVATSILQHNVSLENMIKHKRKMTEFYHRFINAIKVAIPKLSMDQIRLLLNMFSHIIAGGWYSAHQSNVMTQLYDMPEFRIWNRDTQKDLIDSMYCMIKGMLSP
jgi:AcrR family transcriptional regulator